MIGRNLAFGMGWWGNNQSDSYRGGFTTETLPQRLFRRDFTAYTLLWRLYCGDFSTETFPWRLYHGDFTMETLPQRLFCGDFTTETLPRRLYHGDFTTETFPQRLYHGDLLWRPLEGCWGRNQDFIGFLVPITSLTLVGSILCSWLPLVAPSNHWFSGW